MEMMPWEVGDEGSCCRNDVDLTPSPLQHCREEAWQGKVQELPLAAVTDPL